jgi:protoporphyrinogen oxidase
MKVAIIGAGPTGLAMGYELLRNGISVDIYEKDKVVGGLAKSVRMWHAKIELGPHFLGENMNPVAKEFMQQIFAQARMHNYERLSRIYLNGNFLNYPPDGVNFIKSIGVKESFKALLSFLNRKSNNGNGDNVASFVKQNFGRYMYKNFFKDYTEKLWGLPCEEVDAIFLKNLIGFKGNNVFKKIKNMFIKNNSVTYKKSFYPDEGFSMLWEILQREIEDRGGKFHFSANIKAFLIERQKVTGIVFENDVEYYDCIVSTIPETILTRMLPNVPCSIAEAINKINYRSLICVFLLLEHCNLVEDNTIYLYSKQLNAARITNFNRFRNIEGNDIVMLEYWTCASEDLWSFNDERICDTAKNDLLHFSGKKCIDIKDVKIFRLRNAYAIPDLAYTGIREQTSSFLKQFDALITVGRASQNNFNYGMGDAIADGYCKARELISRSLKK